MSLLHPEGEGFSGRQHTGPCPTFVRGRQPQRSTIVFSQYDDGNYERSQERAATKQQRRMRDQYDYDFPPPPGTA